MIVFLLTVFVAYCVFVAVLSAGWDKLRAAGSIAPTTVTCSVIIAVRNEESNIANLLRDLQGQSYRHFEIIIVDDHSTDTTFEIVSTFRMPFLRCVANNGAGKKDAIATGISMADGDIILTTDGDCRVPPTWIEVMMSAFTPGTQMVAGPVRIDAPRTLLERMQAIEFSSLIGSGGAFIALGLPVMANGANLAYRRQAFRAVGGFSGNRHIPSGDDEFLMRKVDAASPRSVRFIKDRRVIVSTAPLPSLSALMQQRIRWASKWALHHHLPSKVIAVVVFSIQVISVLLLLASFIFPQGLLFLAARLVADAFVIRKFTRSLGVSFRLDTFVLLQLLYPFYVVTVALSSFLMSYTWKERKYLRK